MERFFKRRVWLECYGWNGKVEEVWVERFGWSNMDGVISTKIFHFKMEGAVGVIWLVRFGWRIFMKGKVRMVSL